LNWSAVDVLFRGALLDRPAWLFPDSLSSGKRLSHNDSVWNEITVFTVWALPTDFDGTGLLITPLELLHGFTTVTWLSTKVWHRALAVVTADVFRPDGGCFGDWVSVPSQLTIAKD
jgi:hypothetical protein